MKKILIVDDDKVFLHMLESCLIKKGYVIATVCEAVNTFDMLEAFKPDLVIVDVYLDNYDGRTICKLIRSHERYHSIRIILCSSDPYLKISTAQCGADFFIEKPFAMNEILALIEKYENSM
jgi:two-component system alkaline phosphatase synthesis response regulator PhoP